MRLLVLGGSVFLSRAVAAEAVGRGHEVVCACRGRSGSVPAGARWVPVDRAGPLPRELTEGPEFDSVVDVARTPSWVRTAVGSLPAAHWVFISTINVYADDAVPGGGPGRLPLRTAEPADLDLEDDPEAYGAVKLACEQVVTGHAGAALVLRPGLVVGPGDPSGRFGYWPRRLAGGGEVAAPGDPEDRVQVVDVRDLATWVVDSAERRRTGVLDAVGPAMSLVELLHQVRRTCAADPGRTRFTWLDHGFLAEQGVVPWSGPDSIPLWLPRPDYDGMLDHDPTPAGAAGLRTRSLGETAADTLAWLRSTSTSAVSGIDRDRETELLSAWHQRDRS